MNQLPAGKQPHNYSKSQFFMGKSTISMAIFKSKTISLPEGKYESPGDAKSSYLSEPQPQAAYWRLSQVVLKCEILGVLLGELLTGLEPWNKP